MVQVSLLLPFVLALCPALHSLAIPVTPRNQVLQQTVYNRWIANEVLDDWTPEQTAIVIVDMWNEHWCPTMTEGVKTIAPLIDDTITAARSIGVNIVHAPSDCDASYINHPARQRAWQLPNVTKPTFIIPTTPPLPMDSGGCDDNQAYEPPTPVWTHETDLITINATTDYIITDLDQGQTLWNLVQAKRIEQLVYVGVAVNMCVMTRSFGIEQTSQWAAANYLKHVALAREGTDVMFDPTNQRPYCDRAEARLLMNNYLERYWCKTVSIYDFFYAPGTQHCTPVCP